MAWRIKTKVRLCKSILPYLLRFVKSVENTVKNQGKSMGALESEKFEKQKLKKKEEEEKALLNSLYRDVGRLRDD